MFKMILMFTLPLALVGVLTGCAETQRLLANQPDAEAFLARAAAAYGTQPPTLIVEASLPCGGCNGMVLSLDPGRIHLRMSALNFPPVQLHRILAHEYAHLMLHNYTNTSAGLQPAVEMETDAKGVEILMKGDGLTEREAFKAFYESKGGQRVLAGLQPIWTGSPGHGSPCEEIDYLIGRFPEQASWAKRCGEAKPGPTKTQEEIAAFRSDFEACKAEFYPSARITGTAPNGAIFWDGTDHAANEALKTCLRAKGRRIY